MLAFAKATAANQQEEETRKDEVILSDWLEKKKISGYTCGNLARCAVVQGWNPASVALMSFPRVTLSSSATVVMSVSVGRRLQRRIHEVSRGIIGAKLVPLLIGTAGRTAAHS